MQQLSDLAHKEINFACQVAGRSPCFGIQRGLLPIEAEPNAYHVVQHASFVLFVIRSPPPPRALN